MTLAERLSRGVKAMFGASLADMLANALLVVVLARFLLTPDQYGQLNFVLSAVGVVTIVATLGLPKSAARYITEFAETAPGQVPHVMRLSVLYLGTLTVAVAVAVAVLGGPISHAIGTPSLAPFVVICGGYVASRSFANYCSALFQGFNRVTGSAVLGVLTGVGRLVFVTAFVLLGFGVAGALAGYLAASLLAVAFGAVVLYREFYREYDADPEAESGLARRIVEYSVPLTATRSANVIDKKLDTLIVGVLLNMTAVGYYTVAKQVSDFVSMPASAFGFTVSPALGEQKSGNRVDRARTLYKRSLEFVLIAYVPAVTGLILVAGPMVRYVFGPDYLGAVSVIQVFSGFMLVNCINKVTSDGLDFLGRARSRAIVKTTMAVSNVVLNVALIPILGVVGAAAATVITYTVYTLSNVYFIHQELEFDVASVLRVLGVVCVVTLGMAVVVWVAIPHVSGLPSLLGTVGLGVATWAALSTVSGVLDPREVLRFLS